ncbi:MAG: hypothetical protein ACYDC4_08990 [Candidatus Dormibacteria bacterium]
MLLHDQGEPWAEHTVDSVRLIRTANPDRSQTDVSNKCLDDGAFLAVSDFSGLRAPYVTEWLAAVSPEGAPRVAGTYHGDVCHRVPSIGRLRSRVP